MNCCVPEFFLDEDPVFAPSVRSLADSLGEDFVELLWDNGPVFRRTSQEELRNRSGVSASCAAAPAAEPFLDEEMASWLNYQLVEGEDRGFGCHLDLPEKPRTTAATEPSECARRSPSAPGDELESPSTQQKCVRPLGSGESTIIDSNVTSEPTTEAPPGYRACFGGGKRETGACEQGLTSSSAVVCEAEASDPAAPRLDSQKRKAVEADESDSLSESINKKDDTGRSSSKRRLRAAEVHNLSERRRRDRINEKMKTLQELIPRCNKSDKASMLDDAIQYLKFLQAQVQMMSMGRNMYPMMVPGLHHHQYLPQMGMTMPMGMNMNMGMGMSMGTFGGPMPSTLGPLSGVGRPQMGPFLARPNSEANPENVQQFAANRGQRYA